MARQVQRWDSYRDDAWIGEVPPTVDLGRPVRFFVKKRHKKDEIVHSCYVSTLSLPSKQLFLADYDNRGAAEIEQFRNDKSGLSLEARRKRSFTGQKAYILLTDLAHNLLADFYFRALVDSPFADYGPKRIVRDLLHVFGHLVFAQENLAIFSESVGNSLARTPEFDKAQNGQWISLGKHPYRYLSPSASSARCAGMRDRLRCCCSGESFSSSALNSSMAWARAAWASVGRPAA